MYYKICMIRYMIYDICDVCIIRFTFIGVVRYQRSLGAIRFKLLTLTCGAPKLNRVIALVPFLWQLQLGVQTD